MRIRCLLLSFVGLLAGCGIPLSPKSIEATPEAVYLKQVVTSVAAKDYPAIEAALDPEVKGPKTRDEMVKMAEYMPAGTPTSITFLGWNFEQYVGQDRRINLIVEYGYGSDQWLLVTAQLRGAPEHFRLWGFHLQKMKHSQAELNRFTFAGKGPLHYFVLAAAAFAVGFSLYVLVLCLRTRGLRRKWLWVIFILLGVCSFTLNWTTGELRWNLSQINLLSASCLRSGFAGAWYVTFCIPVGAIVFLALKRKPVAPAAIPPAPPVVNR